MSTFDFRYDRWCGWILALFGSGRRFSRVVVGPAEIGVRLGIAFRGTIDRSAIRTARDWDGRVFGWGAHGWGGRWLVNGSSSGIVVLDIDPTGRARVLGFPVKLRELALSLEDPDGFCAALGLTRRTATADG
ncbi:hypothetical protein [Ilumatobacter sp.]|uniref:hypothetical protein n=1 Tax=Ilumatobacter sp. TaxID=1967498 RepID=UPI003AF9A8DF